MSRVQVSAHLLFVGDELLRPRWALEQEKLRQAFPAMGIYARGGQITSVKGWLSTRGGTSYHLRINVPEDYPFHIPDIFIDGLIESGYKNHIYTDGSICVMNNNNWSSSYSLAFMVARAAKWANKYEIWRRTGRWPGNEQEH